MEFLYPHICSRFGVRRLQIPHPLNSQGNALSNTKNASFKLTKFMAGYLALAVVSLPKDIVAYKPKVRSGTRINLNTTSDTSLPGSAANFLEIWEPVILPRIAVLHGISKRSYITSSIGKRYKINRFLCSFHFSKYTAVLFHKRLIKHHSSNCLLHYICRTAMQPLFLHPPKLLGSYQC